MPSLSNISSLPNELMIKILSNIPMPELIRCRNVSSGTGVRVSRILADVTWRPGAGQPPLEESR